MAAHVLDLLKETGKIGCRISRIPFEQNHRIEKSCPVEKNPITNIGRKTYLFMTFETSHYLCN